MVVLRRRRRKQGWVGESQKGGRGLKESSDVPRVERVEREAKTLAVVGI